MKWIKNLFSKKIKNKYNENKFEEIRKTFEALVTEHKLFAETFDKEMQKLNESQQKLSGSQQQLNKSQKKLNELNKSIIVWFCPCF